MFDTSSIEWRFARTGHTSFFIFDAYPILALLAISWIAIIIIFCLRKKNPHFFRKHAGKLYSFIHKVHEISIMYILLTTILEWMYFDSNYYERWLSLGLGVIANVYFLVYELYIYYDMLKYPIAQIGNPKY